MHKASEFRAFSRRLDIVKSGRNAWPAWEDSNSHVQLKSPEDN